MSRRPPLAERGALERRAVRDPSPERPLSRGRDQAASRHTLARAAGRRRLSRRGLRRPAAAHPRGDRHGRRLALRRRAHPAHRTLGRGAARRLGHRRRTGARQLRRRLRQRRRGPRDRARRRRRQHAGHPHRDDGGARRRVDLRRRAPCGRGPAPARGGPLHRLAALAAARQALLAQDARRGGRRPHRRRLRAMLVEGLRWISSTSISVPTRISRRRGRLWRIPRESWRGAGLVPACRHPRKVARERRRLSLHLALDDSTGT